MVTIAAAGEQTKNPRVRDAFFIVEPKSAQLAQVARLIDEGRLQPVLGQVFPLGEAVQAYRCKPAHGKVVLRVAS